MNHIDQIHEADMTHDSAQLSVRENVATTQKNAKVMFFLDFEKKTLKNVKTYV